MKVRVQLSGVCSLLLWVPRMEPRSSSKLFYQMGGGLENPKASHLHPFELPDFPLSPVLLLSPPPFLLRKGLPYPRLASYSVHSQGWP